MGFSLTTTRSSFGDDIPLWHDVVPVDLLCSKRQEDPNLHHYLRYHSTCCQYDHYSSDCCPVRAKPLSSSAHPPFPAGGLMYSDGFAEQPCRVFPLHVDAPTKRWLSEMPVTNRSDNRWICARRYVERILHFTRRWRANQTGFNTVIDYFLAVLAAVELWQFFLRTLHRNPNLSFWSQFSRISGTVRSRRIWQTITLSGPLLLSGCASIVKTYVRIAHQHKRRGTI